MTLYRQLILIVSILFIAGLVGSFSISSTNLRHFLDKQLASHAQDTATSLGLSLSSVISDDDRPVMEAMIDAVFDRGYYQQVEVIDINGVMLLERSNPVRIEEVPDWFVRQVSIETPVAEALVMAGWKQTATVHVRSHPGHAYRELWQNTTDTFRMYLLMALVVTLLGLLVIRIMLRPLQGVESQAAAICQGSYPIQEKLPRTRELRRVVEAMNRVSKKINESFARHSALTERLRNEAYRDTLTGLGNRRWFDQQLQHLLEAQEAPPRGALMLIALRQLDQINAESGYQAGDRLLQRVAELAGQRISHHPDCYLSRISGAEFGVIGASLDVTEAETLAAELSSDLARTGAGGSAVEAGIAHIGMAMWQHGDASCNLLAEADIALRTAQASGTYGWHRYKPEATAATPARGTQEWHDYLQQIIRNSSIALYTQAVFTVAETQPRLIHHELLARATDAGGTAVDARLFMPVAERLGLATDIDRIIVRLAIQQLLSGEDDDTLLAINLSAVSVHDPVFRDWLHDTLADNPATANRLLFELPESALSGDTGVVAAEIEHLSAAGYDCGIDHFGRSFQSLAHLRSLKVRYLKIDGAYTRDIHRDGDKQFLVRSLCDTAHSIDIQVFAGAVETQADADMIARLNVDGVQGHLYGRPEPACPPLAC